MSQIRLTNKPRRGDAALGILGTMEQDPVFATLESIEALGTSSTARLAAITEAGYEYLGPVIRRRGRDVLYGFGNLTAYPSYKWAERYSFRLTGYTLDGTARTGVLSIREASNSWASGVNYTVSYNASTVDALVEQLNAFFQNTANPVFQTQDWAARKESDDSVTLHFAFTASQQTSNTASSGFALTANLLPDSVAVANIVRRHGGAGGEGSISSWYRALSYFRADNSSTAYNPNTDVTSVKRGYPICLPAYLGTSQYQSDHCAFLRSVYGEGESGWLKFMESCLPVNPCDYGNMGMTDGKARTQYLASQTYTSQLKTTATPACPAAYYAANIQTQTQPKGTFWLPTTDEVQALLSDVMYPSHGDNKSDAMNKMQTLLGKANVSNGTFFWSCLRYSASYAWRANGSYGFFYGGYMYYSYGCVPVSLYRLR